MSLIDLHNTIGELRLKERIAGAIGSVALAVGVTGDIASATLAQTQAEASRDLLLGAAATIIGIMSVMSSLRVDRELSVYQAELLAQERPQIPLAGPTPDS